LQTPIFRKTGGIYIIYNTINGKVYVGSSVDLRGRKSHHIGALKRGVHGNKHLQSAWRKYGEDAFSFRVLEEVVDNKSLVEIEQQWIDLFEASNSLYGYNIARIAGSCVGIVKSAETCRKISESKKGKVVHSDEVKKKISESCKKFYDDNPSARTAAGDRSRGRKFSESQRNNMSKARKGVSNGPFSEEARRNISEGTKGRIQSQETRDKISSTKKERNANLSDEEKLKREEAHRRSWETRKANMKAKKLKEQQTCDTPTLEAA
jgi:hypothetical protein